MKKVLITGIGGFLGSHLADAFLDKKYKVVGIDNFIGGYPENVPDGVQNFNVDLDDLDLIRPFFSGVDLVVHSACTAYEGLSVFSPALITRNTSQITANIVSASISSGVKKIVYMSSMARYGKQEHLPFTEDMIPKPQDPYGIAKYASELLLRNLCDTHKMNYAILVPHNIIGPRQKYDDPYRNVASIMINRILQGKQPVIYGNGEQKRCFSFIQDVINPLMHACETDVVDGSVTNIGPDEEFISINFLAQAIGSILNFDLNPIYMPGRPQEVLEANCSAEKARKFLNYSTGTNLVDGLTQLANWIIRQGPKPFNYHLPLEFITKDTPETWSKKLM
jgi:UDP-glucose 4-epimerase